MKKILKAVVLIVWMSVIFYMSSQVADDSTVTTNFVIDIIYKIYSFIFNKNAIEYTKFAELYFNPIRKLAHFTEFGILGMFTYINIKEYTSRNLVIKSLLLSFLYAASDEIHQIFVKGRCFAIKDILIDTSGALLAILLIHLLHRLCNRKLS